jgi:hypothetical protein
MKKYRKRIVDDILDQKLSYMGAVLVEGPKWCGKTTTCEQHANSVLYLDDPDMRDQYLGLAGTKISELLKGKSPRLFDEWQDVPELWDAIRFAVDHSDDDRHFILTGSAVVSEEKKKKIRHSGTGRFSWLRMRPMTLLESGESSGEVSLAALMDGEEFSGASSRKIELDEMAEIVCRGGWPAAVGKSGSAALGISVDYFSAVAESDISRADGIPRDPARVRRLLRSLARLQGTPSSLAAIRRDIVANDTDGLSEDTIYSYLNALERIFAVDNVQAWTPSLRAKEAIRSSETRFFVDPSIATAALGATPARLMKDLRSFGCLFETLCMRDLKTYMEASRGHVFRYHDKTGLECDAVLEDAKGRYALVEIKLGGDRLIQEAVSALDAYSRLVESRKAPRPAFRMVLTAVGEYAYRRPDGIIVCPIGSLRP